MAEGCRLFSDILQNMKIFQGRMETVLEIGCSFGYNLMCLNKKYPWKYMGIDSSVKAVEYGNQLSEKNKLNVLLVRGIVDELPFEDESFDIVLLGF